MVYQWRHLPGDMTVDANLWCPLAVRDTGFGIANSTLSLTTFCRPRSLLIDENDAPEPFWMPFDASTFELGDLLADAQLMRVTRAISGSEAESLQIPLDGLAWALLVGLGVTVVSAILPAMPYSAQSWAVSSAMCAAPRGVSRSLSRPTSSYFFLASSSFCSFLRRLVRLRGHTPKSRSAPPNRCRR